MHNSWLTQGWAGQYFTDSSAVFEVKTGQIALPLLTQQNSGQSKKKTPSLPIRGAGKKAEGGEGIV